MQTARRYTIALTVLVSIHSYNTYADAQRERTIPKVVSDYIMKLSENSDTSVTIAEYEYRGKLVYVVDNTKACCDLGATMYDSSGTIVCRFIGIAGAWESSCADFPKSGKRISTLYGPGK